MSHYDSEGDYVPGPADFNGDDDETCYWCSPNQGYTEPQEWCIDICPLAAYKDDK